jgi:hypothetical protein
MNELVLPPPGDVEMEAEEIREHIRKVKEKQEKDKEGG